MSGPTDTELLNWLERQGEFAVLDGRGEEYPIDWVCARNARQEIKAAMDAEERG